MSVMLVHDPLCNGKSQSGAFEASGLIRPVEALKHVACIGLCHAYTAVLHLKVWMSVRRSYAQDDLIALPCVFCRVIYQDAHRLLEEPRIA